MIFWIIGIISALATFVFLCACIQGKRKDIEFHEAFLRMIEERKEKGEYNLTETLTSGCPVENNK